MKSFLLTLGFAVFSTFSMAQSAPTGAALAAKHGCLICHNVDNKVVGPAFKAVAEKYSAQKKEATQALVLKIKNGGAGQWGRVPMPPHPNVPESELTDIVTWVLGLNGSP